ncbi:MAG: HAMP domain-containing histidine kinase [Deltaproteobacteria bacterium]|nr:HAMP domain-containing histidine kinase [Deltaproteobacteria bacterium]
MRAVNKDLSYSEFITGIIQRLRNPLNALQLQLDSLRAEIGSLPIEEGAEIFDRLQRMQKNLAEIGSFLSEVLRLADIPNPQTASVDINSLVKEVELFTRLESSKKDLLVQVELEKSLPPTRADPNQIKQVILNLLLNAIQASPPKARVRLATQTDNDRILITVGDNGEGIPHADRGRIFEPFFSTKEGASGLGLPLAAAIVKTHGGEISLKGDAGNGSEFVVRLPVKGGK